MTIIADIEDEGSFYFNKNSSQSIAMRKGKIRFYTIRIA
jgi:hypothetical protein